jgi:DHA1 family multidrug resistance protein-like MFS transporter
MTPTTVDVEKSPVTDERHIEREEEELKEVKEGELVTPPRPLHETLSTARKVSITFILCMMTLALTFASTAYSSSLLHLEEYYHTSEEVILLGVALFVLGFALGPLVFGPMAQLIGNRPTYIGSYLCFTAFAFGASEARNIQTLIVMRFFSAVMGSSSLNNVPASIGQVSRLCLSSGRCVAYLLTSLSLMSHSVWQIVPPAKQNVYMIWYAMSAFDGPGLGPVIAGFVDHRAGFRWNLRIQAIFVAVTTAACILFVPETGTPLLKQKASAESGRDGQAAPSKRAFVVATCKTAIFGPFSWLVTGEDWKRRGGGRHPSLTDTSISPLQNR